MPLPLAAFLGGKAAGGALSVGLAGLAAAAFGYNYGYHVRRGYHDFKPSQSKVTRDAISSINPNKQNTGLGMHAAEIRTGSPLVPTNISDTPIQKTAQAIVSPSKSPQKAKRFWSNKGQGPLHWTKAEIIARGKKHGLSARESWKKYANGQYPFLATYRDKQTLHGRR